MSWRALPGAGARRSRPSSRLRSSATSLITLNRMAMVGLDVRGINRRYSTDQRFRLSAPQTADA